VNILSNTDLYLKVRPSKTTDITNYLEPLGFEAVSNSVQGQVNALFRYVQAFLNQSNEERRQQMFYPAAANQAELRIAIEAIPGVAENSVRFYNDGRMSLKLDKQTFFTLLDPTITQGLASKVTQLVLIPDMNGDGSDDVRITYQNGEEQLLYVVPAPEIVAELQALDGLANYAVTTLYNERYLELTHSENKSRRLLKIMVDDVVDEETPTQAIEGSDGSFTFVLDSGRYLFTQPAVQNEAIFNVDIMGYYGAYFLDIQTNGNIIMFVRDSNIQAVSLRPESDSRLVSVADASATGLTEAHELVAGVRAFSWVFRDDFDLKRRQYVYPAAYQPEALSNFLINADTESVTFENNGRVVVDTGDFTFTGVFDATLRQAAVDSNDGIQFSPVNDINQDGTADYQVVYADGLVQYIYTVE
jgi:hypothetical protein